MFNYSLNFFTSTKGHFNCKNIYKYTLNDLFKKSIIFKSLSYKIAHIKISEGEESIGSEMEKFLYSDFKFDKVLTTVGKWSHSDGSSHFEYLKDINKLYSWYELSNIPFGIHWEDDFCFNIENADDFIKRGFDFIKYNHNKLTFRYTREGDEDILQRTNAKIYVPYNYDNIYQSVYAQDNEFSFNPTFLRNSDMKYISKFAAKTYPNIHAHCERAFGLVANYLNSEKNTFGFYEDRFCFVDNKILTHIGTPDFAAKLK